MLLELLVVVIGKIRKSVYKQELGENLGERVILLHVIGDTVHSGVIVGQVGIVGTLVQLFLHLVHAPEVVKIVGVTHGQAVWRLGEVRENQGAPMFGYRLLVGTNCHEIHIVVYVKAVYIIGIACEQTVELLTGSRIVLELILEDYAFIIKALLYNIVGRGNLLFGLWNLLEVVFGLMRVVFGLELFLLLLLLFGCKRGVCGD